MKTLNKWCRYVIAAAGLSLAFAGAMPAQAAQNELALLSSYVGNWQGEGVVRGGDHPDPFRCRLTVSKGNGEKINYAGRCSLAGSTLSITGTIAYNDAAGQYEAVMSSNAGYTGLAVGRQQANQISFDLRERQKDRSGSDVRIGSRILLVNDIISVDFEIEFNDSGKVLTTTVPFDR